MGADRCLYGYTLYKTQMKVRQTDEYRKHDYPVGWAQSDIVYNRILFQGWHAKLFLAVVSAAGITAEDLRRCENRFLAKN